MGKGQEPRILVVDDVMKSGRSLKGAVEKVRNTLGDLPKQKGMLAKVKTLVLIRQGKSSSFKPDYHFEVTAKRSTIILPYGRG